MKILITGGAGFIGSHLADRLVARGDEVLVLDNLSTGTERNLVTARRSGRLHVHRGCAKDSRLVARLAHGTDLIVHLAAAVGVRLIVEHPVSSIETNLNATSSVLHAAFDAQVPVLLASSSEVYGKSSACPFKEDQDLHLGPTQRSRWSYACSKAMDEWLAFAWYQERGLPVLITRLFNTVGPRQIGRYGMVLPNLVQQAASGRPMTIHGNGQQTRSFCHVRDTVDAMIRLTEADAAWGTVVNVGSDQEISIRALAERIRERTGSGSSLTFVPYEQAYGTGFEDMDRRVPDLTRLQSLTGFQPRTTLDTIIDEVFAECARPASQRELYGEH
ncbi:MAG TPA: GDP-mannose 4,6-dehydratase [Planctomycetota bacterium]|nr:GDP-mannose 4,6-dehydratase [Planctomycetota bacterium]